MSKALHITSEVFEKIPNLVIISGLLKIGTPDNDGIQAYLKTSWNSLSKEVSEHGHSSHPLIAQWRKALQAAKVSVKKFPPSIQAIAKRTQRFDEPFSINPIVDTYNAICMDLVLPGGAYDLPQLEGGLQLRVSEGGESFNAIGKTENNPTIAGEIVYADEVEVITRQFLWQQADKGKIFGSTENVVFVFELLTDMGDEVLDRTVETIEGKFTSLLNGEISDLFIHRK
jgi:DNA/RNA-binding domain of Phe-tRNA-synthetase-like protein